MATVLFIVADYTGHLHSTYQIARSLCRRGHTIVYLGTEKMRAQVCAQGFAFHVTPFLGTLPSSNKLWGALSLRPAVLGSLRHKLAQIRALRVEAGRALEELRVIPREIDEIIETYHPDLLIFDPFLLMFYLPFHKRSIPAAAISIFPLFDADPWVPPYTSGLIPRQTVQSRMLVELSWLKCRLQYGRYKLRTYLEALIGGYSDMSSIEVLARETEFELKREWRTRPLYFDLKFESVPELVLTSETFDFPRKKPLPARTHYIGPCVDLERREEEFSWEGIELGEKLILCALGTVNVRHNTRDRESFLHKVCAVARKRPSYSFILAVGHDLDVDAFSAAPPNVYLYTSVPQLQVLKRAHLMIQHGGANSIKECIFLGIPMLIYPMRADQPGNAARIVYRQLGLRGNFKRDTVADIDTKINLILTDPRFRLNVERMREHFLEYQNSQKGIEVLEGFMKPEARVMDASQNERGR